MSVTFPVRYKIKNLPALGSTLGNLYKSIAGNITGSVNDTIIPAGNLSGLQSNPGAPVFDGMGWLVFDKSLNAYKPVSTSVGGVTLDANPSINRTQVLQAKSGTIATLDDAYNVRTTTVAPEGIVSVDWSQGNYKCILNQNRKTALYMINSVAGMEINVLAINNGTTQDLVWDSLVKWPGGTAPAMPHAGANQQASLLVTLININGTIYGESQTQIGLYLGSFIAHD